MNSKILLILFLVITPTLVFSQGGSSYSIFGLGDINHSPGALYEGLGGTAIVLKDDHGINLKNPANWSMVNKTRVQLGYKFSQQLLSTEDQSLFQNNGAIESISGIFSIDTSLGLSLSFGIYQYSNVNYLVSVPFSQSNGPISVSGKTLYQGAGGVSNAYIGFSISPIDGLSLGIMALNPFGKINNRTKTIFNESYTYPADTKSEQGFAGFGYRAGFTLEILDDVMIGGFTENLGTLKITNKLIYQSFVNPDTTFTENLEVVTPPSFGVGFGISTGKFQILSDISFQDFTNFNYRTTNNGEFKNSMQASIGLKRFGNTMAGAKAFDKVTYLFGLGYKEMYYSIANRNLSEIYLSTGASIPMPGTGIIDVGLTMGSRGTTQNNLINEYFARFNVNLSIGESWFVPFRRD